MITANNITVKIRSKYIVKDSSLHIPEGTVAIFIGANGSGKTTTIRAMTGLIPLAQGHSSLAGTQRYADLGLSIGAEYLPSTMRVNQFFALNHDKKMRDYSKELLDSCGMTPHYRKTIGKLSMGMKQKVSICAALRYHPQNIILDEPHNGLDPESIDWLNALIHEQKRRGASILVSSHLLKEVEAVGDIAYQMKDQKISPVSWPPAKHSSQENNVLVVEIENLEDFISVLKDLNISYQVLDDRHVEVSWTVRDVLRLAHEKNFFVENLAWKQEAKI